jgi:NAD(P)-dependent dehydrogenase (short-subunit alcohol dehydrogenase family)
MTGGALAALAARETIARMRTPDLTGQVALITGGSRGLGLALARELADEGCRLAICARDGAELERAVADLRDRSVEVVAVRCDVADKTDVDRMITEMQATYGRVDLLFTVAGVIQVGQLASMELEDFRQAMDIMFWGTLYPMYLCR